MVTIEPKNSNKLHILVLVIVTIFVTYAGMSIAMPFDLAVQNPVIKEIDGEKKESFNTRLFLKELSEDIDSGKKIEICPSTMKVLKYFYFGEFIIVLYLFENRKKYIKGKEYGTSEWANPKALKHLTGATILKSKLKKVKKEEKDNLIQKYSNSDILLTKEQKISLYHEESLNCNTLIVAGSGAGKTTGYAIPNVLQAQDNKYSPCYVLTDPKGEILQRTGYYLKEVANYKVKVLNLKDKKNSFRYNPFKYLNITNDSGDLETSVKKIVSTIMQYQAEDNSAKGEEFWTNMAILCAESLFLATYYGFEEKERTMNTVMELFHKLEIEEDETGELICPLDEFFLQYEEKFKDNNSALSAAVRYKEFRAKCKGRTANSVLATMHSQLSPFLNENIQNIFSDDDMELDKLGEERMAIFVVMPPLEKSFNFVANIFYMQMFDLLEYTATVKHNQKLPIPVRFILDEFFNTGKIPSFDNILSYARSFGISISVIVQSLDQLKKMYDKTWGVIVDNCSTFLYLGGLNHTENLKYIEEKLGDGTYDKRSLGRSRGTQNSSSTNDDKFGRKLLNASEISRLPKRKCILFVSGEKPFYSTKNYFKNHPNYKYTWDANKNNIFVSNNKLNLEKNPHSEENQDLIKEQINNEKIEYEEIGTNIGELADENFGFDQIPREDLSEILKHMEKNRKDDMEIWKSLIEAEEIKLEEPIITLEGSENLDFDDISEDVEIEATDNIVVVEDEVDINKLL